MLYTVFACTGVAMVLPGTLLPLLSVRWHMGDTIAGTLFLFFSVGSSGGALLTRGLLTRTLALGCLFTALGAAALSLRWHSVPLPMIALYGCGLGLAMTSVSLLQSERRPEQRIAEMARLNLTWAIGACVGPSLLLRCAATFGVAALLQAASLLFGLLIPVVFVFVPGVRAARMSSQGMLQSLRSNSLQLLLMIPLATGIESAVGGWLSTYTARSGAVLSVTISALSAFWAGLLLSRLYYSSHGNAESSKRSILYLHPLAVLLGLMLLIGTAQGTLSVFAAFLIGYGLGPLYPLTLALLLNEGNPGNLGFLMAGMGASVLPLLTGVVSGHAQSLRAGLSVLVVAALLASTLGVVKVRLDGQPKRV